MYELLARLVLLLHFAFLLFVVAGGLLVLRWPRLAWVHLPAAAWGALVSCMGWICPLTPLEQDLRARAGEGPWSGGFIEHYIVPVVYPPGLDRSLQVGLGVAVLLLNAILYFLVWRRLR